MPKLNDEITGRGARGGGGRDWWSTVASQQSQDSGLKRATPRLPPRTPHKDSPESSGGVKKKGENKKKLSGKFKKNKKYQ